MEHHIKKDRASVFLTAIQCELLSLLGAAPSHGSVSLEIIFHNSEIKRTIQKIEVSKISGQEGNNA